MQSSCVEYRLVDHERDRDRDRGALSSLASHFDRAAKGKYPFAQPEKSQRSWALELLLLYSPAVILDLEMQCFVLLGELHGDAGAVRMARHVGEQLLEDPEKRRRAVLVRVGETGRDLDQATDARAPLEFARLPLDRRRKPDLIEHFRAQA